MQFVRRLIETAQYRIPPDGYDEYLQSNLWRRIRVAVLDRDEWRCVRCDGDAEDVHHRAYDPEIMDGRALEWLVSLCKGCHKFIHFQDNGERREWNEVEAMLQDKTTCVQFDLPSAESMSRPASWDRMSARQKFDWQAAVKSIESERWAAQGTPETTIYDDFASAMDAIKEIISPHPALLEVLSRDPSSRLYAVLLTQGCLCRRPPDRPRVSGLLVYEITSGLSTQIARDKFLSRISIVAGGPLKFSKKHIAKMERVAIWNTRPSEVCH